MGTGKAVSSCRRHESLWPVVERGLASDYHRIKIIVISHSGRSASHEKCTLLASRGDAFFDTRVPVVLAPQASPRPAATSCHASGMKNHRKQRGTGIKSSNIPSPVGSAFSNGRKKALWESASGLTKAQEKHVFFAASRLRARFLLGFMCRAKARSREETKPKHPNLPPTRPFRAKTGRK